MARRPENPRNRGRRSEGPLDWLNEENQAEQQSGPAPEGDVWQVMGGAPAPRTDQHARPDPGAGTDPRPRADPAAPVLGRRAARAQREALQAGQTQAGQAWAQQQQANQPRNDQARGHQARADQTQAGQAWAQQQQADEGWAQQRQAVQPEAGRARPRQVPADQTQVGLAWPGQLPPGQLAPGQPFSDRAQARQRAVLTPAARTAPPQPVGHHSSAVPATGTQRGHVPADRPAREPAPQAGPRRRQVAIWLTFAALLLAGWSATSFVDSGNVAVAGLATLVPLVSVLALPVIAVGVASKHLVPTGIAVAAALLPWTLVTGYAAAGPGRHTVGNNPTLRVMSVDGAEGRASAQDIVQVTRLYAVDVVVVTDLTLEQSHDLTVAGLSALAPSRWVDVTPGSAHGSGLWARPQITTTPITGLSRPGADGLIEVGTTKIGISVVHLAGKPLRPGPDWRSDLAELASRTPPAKDNFIVGNLNAGPWQPAFRKLTDSKWRDAADVIGQGLRPTWPSWSPLPLAPVDHVLASPGLGVAGADTTNISGSTHRALIVTLILPPAGG